MNAKQIAAMSEDEIQIAFEAELKHLLLIYGATLTVSPDLFGGAQYIVARIAGEFDDDECIRRPCSVHFSESVSPDAY